MSDSTKAEIEIVASTSKFQAALRHAGSLMHDFASDAGAGIGAIAKSLGRLGMRTVSNVLGNLATRGIDLLVEQGKGVLDFEEALVRFGISARKTPMQMREIGNAARQTSNRIGVGALEVLNAGRSYIDLAGAENFSIKKMNLLAEAAQATGASTTDLAGMMYQLTRSMKVPDNELEDTMGGLINQAKDGAIEVKQMSAEFAGILPLFARFGVVGREGTIKAGAMFQVMRDGANSAGEAGTMLQRMYAGIQSFAPRFEANGIQVYKKERDKLGRKVLLPFDIVFKNILKSDAMKDNAVLKKMFGRTEGWRGMLLGDEASRALDKMDASGKTALSRLLQLEEAGRANGVIQADLASYVDSSSGRIAVAVERMKNAVAVAFTPERVEAFAGALTRAASAFMDAAIWVDSHIDRNSQSDSRVAADHAKYVIDHLDEGGPISPERKKQLALELQNTNLSAPKVPKELIGFSSEMLTGPVLRLVGEKLGLKLAAGGQTGTVSAGMLVHQDEEKQAGRRFLGKLGVPAALGGGTQKELADAIHAALAPALEKIAKALGQHTTEVKVAGEPILKASSNADTHRRK